MQEPEGVALGRSLTVAAPLRPAESLPAPQKAGARPHGKKRDRQDRAIFSDKVVQESPSFCMLLEHQQRLDDLISHRKSSIREALGKPERTRGRLRITVTHTYHPPGPQHPPAWTLTIHGRVLDQASPEAQQALQGLAPPGSVRLAGSGLPAGVLSDTAVTRMLYGAAPSGIMAIPTTGSAAPALAGQQQPVAAVTKQPFTSYLRRVEVKLFPRAPTAMTSAGMSGPGGTPAVPEGQEAAATAAPVSVLAWDRSVHSGPHKDSVEVRVSGVGARACISLLLDAQPERFLLPPPLDLVFGTGAETKARISQVVAQYVKQQRLVDAQQVVRLTGRLQEAFADQATMPLEQLLHEVHQRLVPAPPLQIEHTLSPSEGPPPPGHRPAPRPPGAGLLSTQRAGSLQHHLRLGSSAPAQVYDVECDGLGPLNPAVERQAQALFEAVNQERDLEALDSEMLGVLKRLAEHRRRRTMLMGLAQSPVEFSAGLLCTQARELRVIKGTTSITQVITQVTQHLNVKLSTPQYEQLIGPALAVGAREFEAQRRTEFFKGRWLEDAVITYLSQQKHAAATAAGAGGAAAPAAPSSTNGLRDGTMQ